MPHAMIIEQLAARVGQLTGWRRWGVAVFAGAVSVLAMAPFHIWPALALTLPVLVWLIDGTVDRGHDVGARPGRFSLQSTRCAAFVAWAFGFGYFFAGLFWIGEAFLVEAEKFAILIPLAVTIMPAGLALFWGAAAALAALVWRPGLSRVLALALTLAVAEWLRGHVLTGFPWNTLGYALTHPLPLMQSAALVGIYALGLVTVLVMAAPAVAIADRNLSRGRRLATIAASVATVATLFAYGSWRLNGPTPTPTTSARARLVQPSVPQREKWRPENQRAIFEQHLALSRRTPGGVIDEARGIDVVIWPEAAMPFLPLDTPAALEAIGSSIPPGTRLIAGGLRVERPDAPDRLRVFNSLIAYENGRAIAIYDKNHLVPFGEYLPLQGLLERIGLEPLTRMRGGFEAGANPRPLMRLPGLPLISPLVCYEAIFPRAIVQGPERPQLLVNVTNDGWFGNTTGPRQHLHQARVRAVEEGVPMFRVANNGISAVIDAYGRILGRLELNEIGVIDSTIPGALDSTHYVRWGDTWLVLLLAAGATILAIDRQRARRSADAPTS